MTTNAIEFEHHKISLYRLNDHFACIEIYKKNTIRGKRLTTYESFFSSWETRLLMKKERVQEELL